MSNNTHQQDNLHKALGLFIEAFRYYTISVLSKEFGDKWAASFVEALTYDQKEKWNMGLRNGSAAENLIDYHHLKSFAIKYKHLLKADFDKHISGLPSWLSEIADVRHKVAHFQDIDTDDATKAWIHIRKIASILKMTDLEADLKNLEGSNTEVSKAEKKKTGVSVAQSGIAPAWFQVVQPHSDIRQGHLDESVFAANLAEVALGNGREIYNNPVLFFEKTYFTAGLKSIAKTVINGLNGSEIAENRVISLQTGFGGGKTHTLISLYHICKWGKKAVNAAVAEDLLKYTGNPQFENAHIAVFTNTTNDPVQGRKVEGITIRTLWGELAYQLGGLAAYDIIRSNDEKQVAPKGLFKKVLEHCKPALILIDELADYCVSASAVRVGSSNLSEQTVSFMQELTEAVASTNNCVCIVTLPASIQEVGNTSEAHAILSSLQKRVSRVGADTQPVADEEIYEVIRRRLFENIGDPEIIEAVASKYLAYYQSLKSALPDNATKSDYKQKIIKAYPFHPELIDVFRIRWASNHDFQRTRGVLRLLASIVSDLWQRQQNLRGSNLLIHSGQVNFAQLDALSGQLKKLNGNGYDAVISADVAGSSSNAFKIDGYKKEYGDVYLTQSISSVILMNSFGTDGANKGVSVADIKLNTLMPDGFNHNNVNGALDELESSAYYLYYAQTGSNGGKRYWFHTKPNINILVNQAKSDIKAEDIEAEIVKRAKEKTNKNVLLFNVLVDPLPEIPEQMKPTLVLLHPRYTANVNQVSNDTKSLIEKIATKKGSTERIYRNTILFLACSEIGVNKLQGDLRDYLACQKIRTEYNSQLEREQAEDIRKKMEEASKQSDVALAKAYSIVVKYAVKTGINVLNIGEAKDSLDTQINANITGQLKNEEWLLDAVGLGVLRKSNLLPTLTQSIKTKDIYEAFLRFDDKPMITGENAVLRKIKEYCFNGEYAIATGNGTDFTRFFFKENVSDFDVKDDSYWLVNKDLIPKPTPSVYEPTDEPSLSASGVSEPDSPTYQPPSAPKEEEVQKVKSITVSGKVPLEQYMQLFQSFVMPLAHNNIEIEIRIKGKSTSAKPLTTTSQEYKIVKESAKQLGLEFEEE
jgi:predicted AAA+ superfamily ATPase